MRNLCNNNNNMMGNYGMYNPYYMQQQSMIRPNMFNPYPMMPMNYFGGQSANTGPEITLKDSSDKSILEYLQYYFSLENLNKDVYIRNRMNEDGFIDAQEIVNFNKMKNKGVTFEKITQIVKENEDDENNVIESKNENEKFLLRNKNWNSIKEELYPIDYIQQQKRSNKGMSGNQGNTMNYVNMQNNYFFNTIPGMYTPNMMTPNDLSTNMGVMGMMQGMGGYNYPMMNQGGIPLSNPIMFNNNNEMPGDTSDTTNNC